MFKVIYKIMKFLVMVTIIAMGYHYLFSDKEFTTKLHNKVCGVGVEDVKKLEALNSFLEFYDKYQKGRE